jgi:hypothetical protein
MDSGTALRKARALDTLAELDVQEAQLFVARNQALVDVEGICLGQPSEDRAMEFAAMEIAMACRIAQVTATVRLAKAKHLINDLPTTAEYLRRGELGIGQAIAIMEESRELSRVTCALVEEKAYPKVLGLTAGDTTRAIKKIIVTVDAEASEVRRQVKIDERGVWNSPRADGRAMIGADLSAEDAGSFHRGMTALAKNLFDKADPRTLDQQRADLFAQLPGFAIAHLGATPGPSLREYLGLDGQGSDLTPYAQSRVQAVVVVPVQTCLDLAGDPGDLLGYGPVTPAHARDLISAADLRKACADLRSGRLIALEDTLARAQGTSWTRSELESELLAMIDRRTPRDTATEPRHDPSRHLTDLVVLRDPRCSGPGCSMPARDCDLDHLTPYPAGDTSADNLGPASRRCHNAKTHGGWTLEPHPDGSVTWTSPLGRSVTRPSRTDPIDLAGLGRPHRATPPPAGGTGGEDGDGDDPADAGF